MSCSRHALIPLNNTIYQGYSKSVVFSVLKVLVCVLVIVLTTFCHVFYTEFCNGYPESLRHRRFDAERHIFSTTSFLRTARW